MFYSITVHAQATEAEN